MSVRATGNRRDESASARRRDDLHLHQHLGLDQLRDDLEHECGPHVAENLAVAQAPPLPEPEYLDLYQGA